MQPARPASHWFCSWPSALQFGLNEPAVPALHPAGAWPSCCAVSASSSTCASACRPSHYGLTLLGALFGVLSRRAIRCCSTSRPGAAVYGSPLLGMHLDTWSLLLFFAVIAVGGPAADDVRPAPTHDRSDHQTAMRFRGILRFAVYLLIAVTPRQCRQQLRTVRTGGMRGQAPPATGFPMFSADCGLRPAARHPSWE